MYKQQIPGFDLLKFMLALLIVAIHTDFAVAVSVNNYLMRGVIVNLQNLGVPGFFVISSFLFFRKCFAKGMGESNGIWLKFVKRLALVYLFYFILLSPVIVSNRGWFSMDFVSGISTFVMDLLLRYTYPGSWFLAALAVATTLVYFLCKRLSLWLLLGIFFLLHLYISNVEKLPSNFQTFFWWYEEHIREIGLSFPVALFWISLGACFAMPSVIEKLPAAKKLKLYLWGLFLLLFVADNLPFVSVHGILEAFMIICLIILFYNMDFNPSPLYKRLREYSILFFFWHFIVVYTFRTLYHGHHLEVWGVWFYPLTLLIVFAIASTIMYLENKRYFKWLKYSH